MDWCMALHCAARRLPMLVIVAVGVFSSATWAEDWPSFRGADHTGISTETGLLKSWPKGGPKVAWIYRNAGNGYSGPAVVGDRVYLSGTRGTQEVLICLDAAKGTEVWVAQLGPAGQTVNGDGYNEGWGGGPRATPTVDTDDGGHVYVVTARGIFACVSTAGRPIWSKHLVRDFDGRPPTWGYSESPTVDGPLVLYTPGGSKGAILALDKKTGQPKWRSAEFTDKAGYASLITATIGGVKQYITMTHDSAAGVDARNGALLWRYDRKRSTAAIPCPIVSGDTVYTTSGYGEGCDLYKISGSGNNFKADLVYSNKEMVNHHGGVILLDGHLYGHSDGKGWVCQTLADGKTVWREKDKLGKGSCTYADGRLYCYEENTGTVVLLEPSTTGWTEHGRLQLPVTSKIRSPKGRFWTHPVISGGRLYIRDQDIFVAFTVKE